ncbi:alcohol dehydrogenase, partial [Bacteroidota bacterium]
MTHYYLIIQIILLLSQPVAAQSISQWRGPDRNGVFPESGLLKSWPENGPDLLWVNDNLDRGFSPVSVTDKEIFIAGLEDSTEYLTALDFDGNQ